MNFLLIFAALTLPILTICDPISSTTESLVVVGPDGTPTAESNQEPQPPNMKSMNVVSNIRNRYARTVVTTQYSNPNNKAQEATFSIVLPDTAFISGFVMMIKEKKYEAYVREKERAKREYDAAVQRGAGAAHVAVSARDSNQFTVSVNIEPFDKVTFNLTYEQLLVRKHSKYEMVINLHPGQLVKDLDVTVNINETRPIIHVDTPAIRSGNEITDADKTGKNELATVNTVTKDSTEVQIRFTPSVEDQRKMIKALKNDNEKNGIAGQFIVEYDVERDPQGGEVIVNDGYFVHFFAPSDLKPIPKHVVFVLDVSGSMAGTKLSQLKDAMKVILSELHEDDYFNLVKFHSNVQVWKDNNWVTLNDPIESELPSPVAVSEESISQAKTIIEEMHDEGATNIYDALIVGLRLTSKGVLAKQADNEHKPQPIIVFLTDGQANVKVSRSSVIVEMVETRKGNHNKAAIFSLAFGAGANKELLKELSLKNSGFMRTIYEAADSSLQLQDFYKQISSALLRDVKYIYSDDKVKEVTKHNFDIFFNGSEIVVAGKVANPEDKFIGVEAMTSAGSKKFFPVIFPIVKPVEEKHEYGSLERLWVYMTIKQLLDKKYEKAEGNETSHETPKKQALNLALKYSFVTPVTSLVVVKPNETTTSQLEEATSQRPTPQYSIRGPTLSKGYYSPRSGGYPDYNSGAIPWYRGHISTTQKGVRVMGENGERSQDPKFSQTYPSASQPITTVESDVRVMGEKGERPEYISASQPSPKYAVQELSWLKQLVVNSEITIDNKIYSIGDNSTTVEQNKQCQVQSKNSSGVCTILDACPKIYSELDSFETYKNNYFCTLNSDRIAGVCCIDSN